MREQASASNPIAIQDPDSGRATPIPLVDLVAQYRMIRSEIDVAVQRVIETAAFIQGEDVSRFEEEFAAYCEARYAVAVSSGTEALYLAMLARGVGPGDEVITTPHTFIATAEAISQTGALPVFVDIDPHTMNMDPTELEAAVTEATVGILPVHLYGQPVDMDRVLSVARKHRLWVIEDAAQAHGARYKGRRAGSLGDMACFSFYPGKNLGAFGDAGAVVTNDAAAAERVRLLRDHGRRDKYEHLVPGINGRMDTLQAAVLRAKLPHLDAWTDQRRQLAAAYDALLRDSGATLPASPEWTEPVYHLYVVRVPHRNDVRDLLQREDIATGVHYPIPLHLQPAYRSLEYYRGDFPESERAANEVLSLPLYPEMTMEQVETVANAVSAGILDARSSRPR